MSIEKVTVYRFKVWDVMAGDWHHSPKWGTFEAIVATKIGVIDRDSAVEIDAKHLDENGMTAKGFDPNSVLLAGGFPNKVRL